MTKLYTFAEFAAGGAIGLLIGLIAGLSISPVTSTILGALSAGLLILLGLKDSSESAQVKANTIRILGFGTVCSLALILGIILRTHQVLSPAIRTQKQALEKVKIFSDSEIHQILLLTNFGLQPSTNGSSSVMTTTKAPIDLTSGGFLRAGSVSFCSVMRRNRYQTLTAYLDALKVQDPKLAQVIESAPDSFQDQLSHAMSDYLCQ